MRARMIILVDDEKNLLRLFGEMIEGFGFNFRAFSDPREALIFIQDQKQDPDLVITDFVMPQMNGVELIQEVRKINPGIGTICMSGSPDNLRLARKLGCENLLSKPFSAKALGEKINEVIMIN